VQRSIKVIKGAVKLDFAKVLKGIGQSSVMIRQKSSGNAT
jgi:hypothetical protein